MPQVAQFVLRVGIVTRIESSSMRVQKVGDKSASQSGLAGQAALITLLLSVPLYSTGSLQREEQNPEPFSYSFRTSTLLLGMTELMTRNPGSSGSSCFFPYRRDRTLKSGFNLAL